jgi:hypothetical protein
MTSPALAASTVLWQLVKASLSSRTKKNTMTISLTTHEFVFIQLRTFGRLSPLDGPLPGAPAAESQSKGPSAPTRHRGTTKRQQALDPLLCGHAVDRRDN